MPAVSVIVPVHNAERQLRECLDSILGQTLHDIEVLCVDDGSTDGSPALLAQYAASDGRLRVLTQPNAGAGAARNNGIRHATGEFLAFLDADDFFEPRMLEALVEASAADQADVALCRARHFDTRSECYRPAEWLLKLALLPDARPFSKAEIPDHILLITSSVPWNKLFRHSFVRDEGLWFQEIKRANDLYFTGMALVRAARITVVDEVLVNYRVGGGLNLQATNHETPLDFYRALVALRDALKASGDFPNVERSFVNNALAHCIYNLDSLDDIEAFVGLFEALKRECIPELGIAGYPREYYLDERHYERFLMLQSLAPGEFLFGEARQIREHLGETREKLREATTILSRTKKRLKRARKSRAYRIGRAVAAVPRWIRSTLSGDRKAG